MEARRTNGHGGEGEGRAPRVPEISGRPGLPPTAFDSPLPPPVGQIPPARPPGAEAADDAGSGRVIGRIAHGAFRGAVGSMAMTGLREFTRRVGLLDEPPPESIVRQRLLPGPFRRARDGRRRARIELMHWGYGAAGGAVFAALPDPVRLRRGAGPAYGLAVWVGFELALAPLLGLEQARRKRPLDRLALALDHVLYGLVVAETRTRPRE